MELVQNQSFILTIGDSKQSRLRRLKNGVPQGSVLAPLLFNIYTYDLPSMISRKFAYADDLALLHSSGKWKDLEGTLSQDMSILLTYLQSWRLKLSHTKTVTIAFHLNNRETKRELKVYNNNILIVLPFCPTPTYAPVWCRGAHTRLIDSVLNDALCICTNDKPPQRGGAALFPALGRVEMACQFPEGLILGRFSLEQFFFSFFIPAVQCAVTYGQHF